jgi:hypothetical protein
MALEKTVLTVKLDVANPDVMRRRLSELKLSTEGEPADLIARLITEYKRQVQVKELPKSRIGQCEDCGGFSDLQINECPYCGAIDSESDQTDVDDEPLKKEPLKKEQLKKEQPKKEPLKKEQPKKEQPKKESPKKEQLKKEQPKKEQPSRLKIVGTTKSDVLSSNTYLVEKDLDDSISKLKEATLQTSRGLYEFGMELKRLEDLSLWKLRDNGTRYHSFEQFCREELKISRQHAYRIMRVVSNYTENQIEQFGIIKLNISLQIPEESRADLLGDGSDSARTISKRAKELAQNETKSRQTLPIDRKTAVTVAIVPGIVEIPMMKRSGDADAPMGKTTQPATSLKDDPWFRYPLTNNVVLSVRLTRNDKGEIIAIVEHRRMIETA